MGQFSDKVSAFTVKTGAKLDKAVRKITLDLFSDVVINTPVLTGRLVGNWQVAIGAIPIGTLEIEDKTRQITLAKVDAATLALEAGDVIYLANNLIYAIPVEYGRTGGMVRLAVQRAHLSVNAVSESLARE
jgi:hypothetical protein